MKASVAMCTYNGALYIKQQIESIISQSTPPFELVICDDCSTDETACIVKEFQTKCTFPIYFTINDRNLGPTKNFEQCILKCVGDIILLSDQDDIWSKNKVERFLNIFSLNNNITYAFSNANIIDSTSSISSRTLWNHLHFNSNMFNADKQLSVLLKQNVVTGAGLAFRKSLVKYITPISTHWIHDYWISLIGSAFTQGFAIDECLFSYRLHPKQVCGLSSINIGKYIINYLKNKSYNNQLKLHAFQSIVSHIMSNSNSYYIAKHNLRMFIDKEIHLRNRFKANSCNILPRICTVVFEAFSGRYKRYSRNYYSIFRDILRR